MFFSKVLASSVVGATAEEDEGNDDESQASGQPQIPKENCYEVVGTLQDPTQSKPEWVDAVFEVCTLDLRLGCKKKIDPRGSYLIWAIWVMRH